MKLPHLLSFANRSTTSFNVYKLILEWMRRKVDLRRTITDQIDLEI
jgi:hypothetical protein